VSHQVVGTDEVLLALEGPRNVRTVGQIDEDDLDSRRAQANVALLTAPKLLVRHPDRGDRLDPHRNPPAWCEIPRLDSAQPSPILHSATSPSTESSSGRRLSASSSAATRSGLSRRPAFSRNFVRSSWS